MRVFLPSSWCSLMRVARYRRPIEHDSVSVGFGSTDKANRRPGAAIPEAPTEGADGDIRHATAAATTLLMAAESSRIVAACTARTVSSCPKFWVPSLDTTMQRYRTASMPAATPTTALLTSTSPTTVPPVNPTAFRMPRSRRNHHHHHQPSPPSSPAWPPIRRMTWPDVPRRRDHVPTMCLKHRHMQRSQEILDYRRTGTATARSPVRWRSRLRSNAITVSWITMKAGTP